jgi:hypothetical protein
MSSLTDNDKRYLERLLEMGAGYVLDYTDATFAALFARHKINIHGSKYQTYGTSKAKKLRAFWDQEPDAVVAQVLSEVLDSYEAYCDVNDRQVDAKMLDRSRSIVNRLSGTQVNPQDATVERFLERDFTLPEVNRLPVESQVARIIEARLEEIGKVLKAGAYLSGIVLCGSILEAVLLGAARNEPRRFNLSSTSPKDKEGKVKPLHAWSLAQFIDTACEAGVLSPDVKKFSHGLRDFRNLIHPYQQLVSDFTPDKHTATVCFQVLKAALADVSGER